MSIFEKAFKGVQVAPHSTKAVTQVQAVKGKMPPKKDAKPMPDDDKDDDSDKSKKASKKDMPKPSADDDDGTDCDTSKKKAVKSMGPNIPQPACSIAVPAMGPAPAQSNPRGVFPPAGSVPQPPLSKP